MKNVTDVEILYKNGLLLKYRQKKSKFAENNGFVQNYYSRFYRKIHPLHFRIKGRGSVTGTLTFRKNVLYCVCEQMFVLRSAISV